MSAKRQRAGRAARLWFESTPQASSTRVNGHAHRLNGQAIEPKFGMRPGRDGKWIVRCFVSYAAVDKKLMAAFLEHLKVYLAISSKYQFEIWTDRVILPGERWDATIKQALIEMDLCLLLVSPAVFASNYIVNTELKAMARGCCEGIEGKRIVPVALKPIDLQHTDLKGIDAHQIFHDSEGQAFAERVNLRREAWVRQLVEKLHQLVDKYGCPDLGVA